MGDSLPSAGRADASQHDGVSSRNARRKSASSSLLAPASASVPHPAAPLGHQSALKGPTLPPQADSMSAALFPTSVSTAAEAMERAQRRQLRRVVYRAQGEGQLLGMPPRNISLGSGQDSKPNRWEGDVPFGAKLLATSSGSVLMDDEMVVPAVEADSNTALRPLKLRRSPRNHSELSSQANMC